MTEQAVDRVLGMTGKSEFGGMSAGIYVSYRYYDALGVRCAHIVEQAIGAANDLGEFVHDCLDLFRAGRVKRICSFARLEEHIRVLRRAAEDWMIGGKSALPVFKHAIYADKGAHLVFIDHCDLVDFM